MMPIEVISWLKMQLWRTILEEWGDISTWYSQAWFIITYSKGITEMNAKTYPLVKNGGADLTDPLAVGSTW